VLFWVGVLLIGAFGVVFTFTNYPLLGIGIVLVALLLIASWERRRRRAHRALVVARRQARTRRLDRSNGLDPQGRPQSEAATLPISGED
jgi:hypothetical protein